MTRILLLPITLPLRAAALQLRLARGAAELALDLTREIAGGRRSPSPSPSASADAPAPPPPAPPAPARPMPATPRPAGPDPAEAPRAARRAAAVQRTRARREPPAPLVATDIPSAEEPPARPRPRRAARKATAAKPARKRTSGPTRGEVAAMREAQRETEAAAPEASVGPSRSAGPEIRVAAPWEDYDALRLDEVLARLENADAATVAAVRLYEGQHENRQAVLLATETE
jgi:hypothetical protein